MGVERWLYQRLNSPAIKIEGKVEVDLLTKEKVTWINQGIGGNLIFNDGNSGLSLPSTNNISQIIIPEIRTRGGCELDVLSHYLQQETAKLVSYTNYPKGAFLMRLDNTINLGLSLSPLNDNLKQELAALQLNQNDFSDDMFSIPVPSGSLFIITTWGDLYLPVYRHNILGVEISMALWAPGINDLTQATPDQLEQYFISRRNFFTEERKAHVGNVAKHLAAHYTFIGITRENSLRTHLRRVFERIPKDCQLAVILPSSHRGSATALAMAYHAIVRETAKDFSNVFTIDISQFIHRLEDIQDIVDHFDRMIYFNLYKTILQTYQLQVRDQAFV